MRRAPEPARESLSFHVTRKQGNPHSRPLTQMTIFGKVRQWNRPRRWARGWAAAAQGRSRLGSPRPREPASSTPATTFLPRAGCAAGVSVAPSTGREGNVRPPLPCLFLLLLSSHSSSSFSRASFSRLPRAPPCKVESGVDVSESTWYRGWRIKSVKLNSCHCSDSSRAERRGSERSSEAASKRAALGGDRERASEPRAGGRGGRSRSGRPRRGAGPGSRAAAVGAGPRPSRLEPHGRRTGAGCLLAKCPSRSETPAVRRPQEVYFQLVF